MIWTKKPVSKEISELNASVETLHNSLSKMGLSPARYNYNNSLDAVKSTLQTFVNGLANNSVGVCILAMTAQFDPFAGGDWFAQIYKTDNTYFSGVITSYAGSAMVYVKNDVVYGWTFKPFANKSDIDAKFSPTPMSTDANNAITSGMYYLTSDCANRPADWCIMTVVAYNSDILSQTATSVITGKTYVRSKSINGWTSWEELALNSKLLNHSVETVMSVYVQPTFENGIATVDLTTYLNNRGFTRLEQVVGAQFNTGSALATVIRGTDVVSGNTIKIVTTNQNFSGVYGVIVMFRGNY